MFRLRILFAWLLMAAVPMQGFAAASMLFCGTDGRQHVHAATQGTTTHNHHDHAMHDDADHVQVDAKASHAAHGAPTDTNHKCSICAACCNSIAIIATEPMLTMAPAPQSALAEPLMLIHTRPSPVPDKPPRA